MQIAYDPRLSMYLPLNEVPDRKLSRWLDDYRKMERPSCTVDALASNERDARALIAAELSRAYYTEYLAKWAAAGQPVIRLNEQAPVWLSLAEAGHFKMLDERDAKAKAEREADEAARKAEREAEQAVEEYLAAGETPKPDQDSLSPMVNRESDYAPYTPNADELDAQAEHAYYLNIPVSIDSDTDLSTFDEYEASAFGWPEAIIKAALHEIKRRELKPNLPVEEVQS